MIAVSILSPRFCAAVCVAALAAACSGSDGSDRVETLGTVRSPIDEARPVRAYNAGGTARGWYGSETGNGMSVSNGTVPSPLTATVKTKFVYYPAPMAVYQSYRRTNSTTPITYTLSGLTPGAAYHVRLHFAEPSFSQINQRKFNVSINGQAVLSNYDVVADAIKISTTPTAAGTGLRVAVVKSFNKNANASGQLTITLSRGSVNEAFINGIEVLSGTGHMIDAGSTTGADIGAYRLDGFFDAGSLISTSNAINTTLIPVPPPQDVLKTAHTNAGDFTYTVPNLKVSQIYDVRLYFAETDPAITAAGQRYFDVHINGKQVLQRFDPFAAGGKSFWGSERTFEAVAEVVIGGGG